MGILVSSQEVVTCAHVLDDVLGVNWHRGGSGAVVRVAFPFQGETVYRDGIVDRNRYTPRGRSRLRPSLAADVAVIQLAGEAPEGVQPAMLGTPRPGAAVKAYGFRSIVQPGGLSVSHPDGEWARGTISGSQPGGRMQFDGTRISGHRIQRGYSGAAVFDENQEIVVGMVVEADRDESSRVAQLIDADALIGVITSRPNANDVGAESFSSALGASARGETRKRAIEASESTFFVGRVELKQAIIERIAGGQGSTPLHIIGHGGIGKSSLLQQLAMDARSLGRSPAYIDLAFVRSPLDLLRRLAQTLQSIGEFAFSAYAQASARYERIEAVLLRNPKLSQSAVVFVSKRHELQMSHYDVPESVDIGLAGVDQHSLLSIYAALDADDRSFFLSPLNVMADAFGSDVEGASSRSLFLLDRTEKIPAHLGEWLWRDLLPLIRGITIITAGRNDIPPSWQPPPGRVKIYELGPLTAAEVQEYLSIAGVREDSLRDRIARSSAGIPLALELAVESAGSLGVLQQDEDVDAFVVDRMIAVFLGELSAEHRTALQRLAVFRRFNRETLNAFNLGDEAAIISMLAARFMKHDRYGYAVHDSVRDFILRDLRRQEPTLHASLHSSAAAFYAARRRLNVDDDQYFIEWLYHVLSSDPPEGFKSLRSFFSSAALAIKPELCESIIKVAYEADFEGALPESWIRFYEGSLYRQRFDFAAAERTYEELLATPGVDSDRELMAELLYQRSVALWYLCRYEESITVAGQSMLLNDEMGKENFYNRSLGIVGLALDRLGRFDDALVAVKEMLSRGDGSQPDPVSSGYALNSIGYFSWHAGRWGVAEESLLNCRDRWVALKSPVGECYPIGHLGGVYAAAGHLDRAAEMLERGRQLSELTGNSEMLSVCLQNSSMLERRRGNLVEARSYAERAMNVSASLNHSYFLADSARLLAEARLEEQDLSGAEDALEVGAQAAFGTGAVYLQGHLDVVTCRCAVARSRDAGDSEVQQLRDRLMALSEGFVAAGYYDLACWIDLLVADIRSQDSPSDCSFWLLRGASHAFSCNWYMGMDYLERVQSVSHSWVAGAAMVEKLRDKYNVSSLWDLYVSEGSWRLRNSEVVDVARSRKLWT
ncbi:trypsin-like peptidase domain-containing protein [Pseudonocardia petroleophila]|nr:trypsin-like peptidase domain-containing protein [Pseudonocardia petroleophila]